MEVRLVVEEGRKRKSFTLPSTSAVIGRARGNAVRIPSAEVSRRHCRLRVKDGLVTVEDLNSVNGTFVNGELVEGKQTIGPGDRLEVGPVTFIVEYEMTADALERLRAQLEGLEADFEVLEEVNEEDEKTEFEEMVVLEEEGPARAKAKAKPEPEKDQEPEAKEDPELAAVAQEEISLDLSFIDEPWEAPAGDDLRDLLAQLEEDEAPKPEKKKKS
jgi:pSer/pThr/pTyr-binding forkhead associated (FHA) protein